MLLFFLPAIVIFILFTWLVAKVFFKADPQVEEPTDLELEEIGFPTDVLNPPGPRYF